LTHAGSHDDASREGEIDLLVELGRLTERQRTVLVAHHALGLSHAEIGALFGIAPSTVGAIAYQATRKLRERLGGER
jgi:RNA polymerase sigma factor (sigma-70 family)